MVCNIILIPHRDIPIKRAFKVNHMTNVIQKTADKVVDSFKQELSPEALNNLSAADFDRLTVLIRNALSKDREETSVQLEELARKLKADIEYFDLGL